MEKKHNQVLEVIIDGVIIYYLFWASLDNYKREEIKQRLKWFLEENLEYVVLLIKKPINNLVDKIKLLNDIKKIKELETLEDGF
jgi:hypothetical protein